jgi:hypothetical protein
MSDYTISNRETVVNTLTSRVIENAPLRELIRVYSEAVGAAIGVYSFSPANARLGRMIAAAAALALGLAAFPMIPSSNSSS